MSGLDDETVETCVACGRQMPTGNTFCTSCGHAMVGAGTMPPDKPSPTKPSPNQHTIPIPPVSDRPTRRWPLVIGALALLLILCGGVSVVMTRGNAPSTADPVPPPVPSSASAAAGHSSQSAASTATRYFATTPAKSADRIVVGAFVEGQNVSGWGASVSANWGFCFKGDIADNVLAGVLFEGTGGPVELSPFAWDVTGTGSELTMLELGPPLSLGVKTLTPITSQQADAAFAGFGGLSAAQVQEQFKGCRKTIRLGEASQR